MKNSPCLRGKILSRQASIRAERKIQNSIIQNCGKAATIQNSKLKIQNSYSHSQIQEKFAHKFRNFYIIVWKSEIYALLKVKLGGTERIEEGATNLKELADKLDTTKMPAPSFMAVVIGVGQYAYKRKDGVYVIPIGCLKD